MTPLRQSQSTECGLAALAMACNFHGAGLTIASLRSRFGTSGRGLTLHQLVQYAGTLGFSARPLRADMAELAQLKLPCILHWDLNHYVVLKAVSGKRVVVLDPAIGERKLSLDEVSRHFTGVALELTPRIDFAPQPAPKSIRLTDLMGKVVGLKPALLQIFGVAAVLELFAIVAPLFQQMVVDEVLTSGDRDLLTVLAVGFCLLLVIQTAISFARSWMVIVLSQSLAIQWASNVFAHLVRLPVEFFERRHLGDIASRFGAVQSIQKTLTTSVVEAVLDGLMALVALVMMLLYAPSLAVVTVVAVIAYGLLRWMAYSPFRNAAAERLIIAARENTHFLETLRAIAPLKLFGREEERRARWENLIVEVQNRDTRTAKMSMAFSVANSFIFGLENLLVLWLGARLILNGMTVNAAAGGGQMFTVGMLFAFISYKSQFSSRVSTLINYGVELKMLNLHGERLADIVLERPELDTVPPNDLAHLVPSIELRGVSYRYGEGEPWILHEVDLKIEAGESVAIVGASGAGKTTLLKIALGLLEPSEGEVLYGGKPVKRIGMANYRRQIGTVLQEDTLLTGSLADNIAFFDAMPDQDRVQACAEQAQLHHDISRMPMGYQTLVGDLGAGLSGGQKQRLLLARALYKQPRVLALDEATSHLDLRNERAVTAELSKLSLTRMVIAHRPETIAGAQRVVQVRRGKAVELAKAMPSLSQAVAT